MGSLDDIKPMKEMESSYLKTAFPEDVIPATFFGTSIYWRPQTESSEDATPGSPLDVDAGSTKDAEAKIDPDDSLAEKLAAASIT